MEPTREQLQEIRAAQDAIAGASDEAEAGRLRARAEDLMRKYGAAEEPSPDLLDDEPTDELDPAALALALVQARADGDEASARAIEAMLPPA